MFWITQVILKDVKIGYGETAVLRHYHQDAVDLYNLCCDLRRVCETLAVRSERLKRQDLEPGALVKAMMASRAHGCAKAFEAMRDRPFVIETKFDGERIQVHRTDANSPLRYFTRNNNDFGPRGYDVLDRLFRARLKPSKTRCVFDGELVVWNTRDGVYAPFGYIKSLVNAIRDNRGGDERCVPEDPRGPAGGGAARRGRERLESPRRNARRRVCSRTGTETASTKAACAKTSTSTSRMKRARRASLCA